MNDIPLSFLFGFLGILILLSGFFSSSETAMMSLNRYRLRHLEKKGHHGAKRASALLKRPDRLIGVILIGNNLVNTFATALTTLIALRLYGEGSVWLASVLLTIVILIFSEVTPKTIAALHPEKIAFPFSVLLRPLLILLYPVVWVINHISNALALLFGVNAAQGHAHEHLNPDELRTVVGEAGGLIPDDHQDMLLNILDLEKASVEDIMIPRNEVIGIDLEDDIDYIINQLESAEYTRLPVYEGDINHVIGILHLRFTPRFMKSKSPVTHADIKQYISTPYFVPESTPLHKQLIQFKEQKHSIALVVDEYGEVQGLITLADLLEEIVGDFTTNLSDIREPDIQEADNDWYTIDGGASIRDVNRNLDWQLPTDGPKTLNGLMMEYLENIPKGHISFIIDDYVFETIKLSSTMIESAKVKLIKIEEE
ncbi:MAG: HlyC/CorC family transporter [Cellvibrionaceae bacterium]